MSHQSLVFFIQTLDSCWENKMWEYCHFKTSIMIVESFLHDVTNALNSMHLIRSTRWNAWQSFIKAIVGWCNSNNYSLWTSVPKLTGYCSPLHQTWVKKSDSLLFWCVVWECSLFCKVAYKQNSGIACAWIKQKHIPVLTDFTKGLLKHKMSSCSESNTVDTNTVTYHKNCPSSVASCCFKCVYTKPFFYSKIIDFFRVLLDCKLFEVYKYHLLL